MMRVPLCTLMRFLAVSGLLSMVLISGCSTENTPVAELAATAAATSWLHSVDVDSLAIAYDEAGAMLQERRTRSDWIENVQDARKNMGPMLSRQLETRRYENEPSRYPEGAYVIVSYTTDFTHQVDVEELLVMRLNDGIWRPERYIIDPGP